MITYYDLGGTHRSRSIEETLIWLQPKLSQIGITRVANITGLDNIGIPITTSIRPNSKFLSVSQGKGISLELSKISSIMESIEAYHAEIPPIAVLKGSYAKLKSTRPVVNPTVFMSGAFDLAELEQYSLDWVLAEELISKVSVYIPHPLVCLDTTIPRMEYGFFNVSTNGLAAGNTIEEALCHALYEVIERENLSRLQTFSDTEILECQLELNSINDEINKNLLSRLQSQLQVVAWDITGQLGIPTFHAAIWDPSDPMSGRVHTGSGTHVQKEIALSRALTEAAQARLTIISGMRDDIFPEYYVASGSTLLLKQGNSFSEGKRNFQDCEQPKYENSFSANIQFLIKKLLQNNYSNIYWVNHTKSEIGVPVIQLFVPGLQHDHSRM